MELEVGQKVSLPFGETGTIKKIKDIPWGFKYLIKINKGVFNKTNEILEFKKEQIQLLK
jgi:hypothetical protein